MSFAGRTLRFPDDRALGHLYNMLPDGSWEHLGRAQRSLWVPASARVHLSVTDAGALGVVERLDPHAFYSIDLHRADVADEQLAPLGHLAGLRKLFLSRARRLGDAALAHLRRLWALKTLAVDRTRVTDEGLGLLAGLRSLQELDLGLTRVRGPALVCLRALPSLRVLGLADTRVDDAAVLSLAELPALQELILRGSRVTPRGAAVLLARRPGLSLVGNLQENEHRLELARRAARVS